MLQAHLAQSIWTDNFHMLIGFQFSCKSFFFLFLKAFIFYSLHNLLYAQWLYKISILLCFTSLIVLEFSPGQNLVFMFSGCRAVHICLVHLLLTPKEALIWTHAGLNSVEILKAPTFDAVYIWHKCIYWNA